jgi:hypothetical protein
MDYTSLIRGLITQIDVQSAYTPDISLADPFAPAPPSDAPQILQDLKPKITIHFGGGMAPLVIMPYGEPGPTQWESVQTGLSLGTIAFGGFLLYGVLSLLSSRR